MQIVSMTAKQRGVRLRPPRLRVARQRKQNDMQNCVHLLRHHRGHHRPDAGAGADAAVALVAHGVGHGALGLEPAIEHRHHH